MPSDKALPLLGMVLVTHGRLAEEMVTAMEHVVGPQRAIATVCIGPNDNMEMRRKEIADAIRTVDEGRGVIMLTDLFGGTPSNLAISLLESGRTEVIAGVNLPMLIRLESARKAAQARDRSHFGVPAGFDRFRPWLRQKALKYIHIPAPFFLALNEIASNLDRQINGS